MAAVLPLSLVVDHLLVMSKYNDQNKLPGRKLDVKMIVVPGLLNFACYAQ
jgi:hypothetical protein